MREISGEPWELPLNDLNLWIFLVVILLVTGVASGIYPAFYISKFQAANIFRGSVRFGRKNTLSKALLATQLVFTCAGITGAVMSFMNQIRSENP